MTPFALNHTGTKNIPLGFSISSPPIEYGNAFYTVQNDRTVLKINASGQTSTVTTLDFPVQIQTIRAYMNGLFVLSIDGVLRRFDIGTGLLQWRTGTENIAQMAPAYPLFLVRTKSGDVKGIEITGGTTVWKWANKDIHHILSVPGKNLCLAFSAKTTTALNRYFGDPQLTVPLRYTEDTKFHVSPTRLWQSTPGRIQEVNLSTENVTTLTIETSSDPYWVYPNAVIDSKKPGTWTKTNVETGMIEWEMTATLNVTKGFVTDHYFVVVTPEHLLWAIPLTSGQLPKRGYPAGSLPWKDLVSVHDLGRKLYLFFKNSLTIVTLPNSENDPDRRQRLPSL